MSKCACLAVSLCSFVFATALAVAGIAVQAANAGEAVSIGRTRVSLVVPDGFVDRPPSSGTSRMGMLFNEGKTAVIVIREVPFRYTGGYETLTNPARLPAKLNGIFFDRQFEPTEVNGRNFLFSEGTLTSNAEDELTFAIFEDGISFTFSGNFTAGGIPDFTRELIFEILGSVEISTLPSFEKQISKMGLELVAKPPFLFNYIANDHMVVLSSTDDAMADVYAPGILISLDETWGRTLRESVEAFLLDERPLAITSDESWTFVGAAGIRLTGAQVLETEKNPFVLYAAQVDERVIILFTTGEDKHMTDKIFDVVDEIAASVRLRAKPNLQAEGN